MSRIHSYFRFILSTAFLFFILQTLYAQSPPPPPKTLTLDQAVNLALANYPAIRAAQESATAAHAGVSLAKTAYLPRTDLLWQANRASRNNVFGLLLPQSVIPSVSGPVLTSTSNQGVWGSAAGMLLSWEPFDFGYRRATVSAAQANEGIANANTAITRLDVAIAAAGNFLAVLAAQERVRAVRADLERREVFARAIHALVDNQLRPGADASRADAELAGARIRVIQAETAVEESRATLAAILGFAGTKIEIDSGALSALPPNESLQGASAGSHPLAIAGKARMDAVQARERILGKSYFPKFNFQSSVYGRGTGANTDGTFAGGAEGLGLQRSNWAAGLTVTFPVFDFKSLNARKQIEAANEHAEKARYDQTVQDLAGQIEKARAAMDGARRVAENTPIQLRAARESEAQARARYDAGLGTLVDVVDAQRLLVQAEVDDALARLNVWAGLLSVSAAQGDLKPLLQLQGASPKAGF